MGHYRKGVLLCEWRGLVYESREEGVGRRASGVMCQGVRDVRLCFDSFLTAKGALRLNTEYRILNTGNK